MVVTNPILVESFGASVGNGRDHIGRIGPKA